MASYAALPLPFVEGRVVFLPGREDELVVEPDREPKEELREH